MVGRRKDPRRRVSRHRLLSKRTLPYSSRSCIAPESSNQMNIHEKLPHETKNSVTLWKASNNRPWSIMCFNWIWCSAGVSSTTAGVTARDWIWAACWKGIDNEINDEIKNKKMVNRVRELRELPTWHRPEPLSDPWWRVASRTGSQESKVHEPSPEIWIKQRTFQ